ncbi:MAG: hypothetical protein IKP86_00320 [Anaerolineaceae bacterium]|nr:hypothetical protein [Anaerolineaceae bacterium]
MVINANNGEIVVEGNNNIITNITWSSEEHLSEFLDYLYSPPPLCGTFYPEPETMQAAYAGLLRLFYDRFEGRYNLTVIDGDLPEIPQPDGPGIFF